jgi:succinoglycan biosynthesis transport protein ExoP
VPVYTANATLIVDARRTNIVNSDAVLSGIGNDSSAIDSELVLIRSTPVARRVVKKLKLTEHPAFVGKAKPSLFQQIKSGIFGKPEQASDEQAAKGDVIEEIDLTDSIAASVRGGLSAVRKDWSYVIGLSYTHPNPDLAAALTNAFAEEYLVDQLEAKYEATKRANAWLTERLSELKIKVRDSEQAVALYKAENNMVEAQGLNLGEQEVAKLNEQLILARAETAQAKANYDQLLAVVKRGGVSYSFADGGQSAVIGSLRAKMSETRRELAELQAKYGQKHPSVVSARAQLSDLGQQIRNESKRTVAAAENKYKVALSREKSIESSFSALKGSRSGVSQEEITLRELEREAAANRTLFESFLGRFKEVTQQETLQTAETRIIERATVPGSPSAPNKRMIALISLVLGLGLGGGLAFLLEMLDAGFRTGDQVEKLLGVPVLASVPRADREVQLKGMKGLVERLQFTGKTANKGTIKQTRKNVSMSRLVSTKPLSTFTEAVRSLRMGMKYASVDNELRTVLVSSALPGEGKSTIASNLALLAANTGEKVLLIDMDLRHPVVTSQHAPDAKVGIVEIIMGQATMEEAAIYDERSGMCFIPAVSNKGLTHTSELLGSQRTKNFLNWARGEFDLVVVDTSPLIPVTDGRALIGAVDAAILVVKWEKTHRAAVQSAIKQTPGIENKLVGIVLNDVVPEKARHYDYYKSGYHDKKYPYYYGDQA